MHTLGYRFKPWIHDKSIADGPSILEYLNETIDENSLRDDESINELDNENILYNAPETTSGQIKIPRVFDNE